MTRLLLGAAAVALLPTAAFAQYPVRSLPPASPGLAAGTGTSYYRPAYPGPSYTNRPVIGGYGYGLTGLYPYTTLYPPYSAYVGGYYGGYYGGYGYGSGYMPYPVASYAAEVPPVEVAPPTRIVELSTEYPATLTLQFPAAAKVWLDGKEVPGDAAATRDLTSPVLTTGQTYTFKVRATWDVKGQPYEYTREVTLGPGDRSKLMVAAGTPVAQK